MKIFKKLKEKKRKYPKDISWDIGFYALEFVNQALKYFVEDAPKVVDLEDRYVECNGEKKDILAWVVVMINMSDSLLAKYFDFETDWTIEVKEFWEIFGVVAPYLWW